MNTLLPNDGDLLRSSKAEQSRVGRGLRMVSDRCLSEHTLGKLHSCTAGLREPILIGMSPKDIKKYDIPHKFPNYRRALASPHPLVQEAAVPSSFNSVLGRVSQL